LDDGRDEEASLLGGPTEEQEVATVDASLGRELTNQQQVVPGELSSLMAGAQKLHRLEEKARAVLKPTRMMAKSEARIERRAGHLGAHAESMTQMANNAKLASSEQKQLVKQGEDLTMNAAAAVATLSLARDEAWSQVDGSAEEQDVHGKSLAKLRKSNAELRKLSDLSGEAAAAAKKMERAARVSVQEQRKAQVISKEQVQNAVPHRAKQIQQLAAAAQGHEDTAAARLGAARREVSRVAAQIEQLSDQ